MSGKVINFSSGSKYYYQLGNYYYSKNNLDKALTYYERALAVDPDNPANRFNLACLLSELGQYQKSTAMFKHLMREPDNKFSESWFWLAMNCGQQQKYREAGQYLRKYLEHEPDGDYSWQAEEILEYLRTDLPMLSPNQRLQIEELSYQGMELISQGQLTEAIACFSEASAIEPVLTAPQNNLALSWFQMGKVGKAAEVTREVLGREPDDLFANCNLAAFSFILNDEITVRRQVQILDRLWNDDPDEMLKLGTTYGLLGLDRRAMYLFRNLRELSPSYEILLLLGVATYNCGYRREAARIFQQASELEPDSPYRVYRQHCYTGKDKIPYHLRIPNEAIAGVLEGKESVTAAELAQPDTWPQVLWVIKHCSASARQRLSAAILDTGNSRLAAALSALIWQGGISNWQKDLFSSLQERGHAPWSEQMRPRDLSSGAVQVLTATMQKLTDAGCGYFPLALAHECWTTYWRRKRPPIRNTRLWAAALMVFVQGRDDLETVAAGLGLAPASLAQAVRKLTVCI